MQQSIVCGKKYSYLISDSRGKRRGITKRTSRNLSNISYSNRFFLYKNGQLEYYAHSKQYYAISNALTSENLLFTSLKCTAIPAVPNLRMVHSWKSAELEIPIFKRCLSKPNYHLFEIRIIDGVNLGPITEPTGQIDHHLIYDTMTCFIYLSRRGFNTSATSLQNEFLKISLFNPIKRFRIQCFEKFY